MPGYTCEKNVFIVAGFCADEGRTSERARADMMIRAIAFSCFMVFTVLAEFTDKFCSVLFLRLFAFVSSFSGCLKSVLKACLRRRLSYRTDETLIRVREVDKRKMG